MIDLNRLKEEVAEEWERAIKDSLRDQGVSETVIHQAFFAGNKVVGRKLVERLNTVLQLEKETQATRPPVERARNSFRRMMKKGKRNG